MCLSPVLIKNPNKGLHHQFSFLKDTSSDYIKVPCGHCPECAHKHQMDVLQRCQTMALDHHVFFGTFTYNNDMIPHLDIPSGEIDPDTGEEKIYSIKYADIHDFQNTIKRIRKRNAFTRPFSYFVVSELGEKRGRPHFHALFFVPVDPCDNWMDVANLEYIMFREFLSEWKRNVKFIPGKFTKPDKHGRVHPKVDTKHPVWVPLCTYFRKFISGRLSANYDLHYVKPTVDSDSSSVSAYVTKYMMKPSTREKRLQQALRLNLSEKDYETVWLTVKPSWRASKNFGASTPQQIAFVRDSVQRSKRSSCFPLYLAPNGNTYPLARYYRSDARFCSVNDEIDFYNLDPDRKFYDNMILRNLEPSQVHSRIHHHSNLLSEISHNDSFSNISDLINNG